MILLLITSYIGVFLLSDLFYRLGVEAFISRKISHLLSGLISAILPFLVSLQDIVLIGLVILLILLLSQKTEKLAGIHNINKKSFGAIFFPIGLVMTALIFWEYEPLLFTSSALVLGLSDGLAALVGHKYGKHKIFKDKTAEGSLAFLSISSIIIITSLVFIFDVPFKIALLNSFWVSFLLMGIELYSWKGTDNLLLPVATAFVLFLIL